MKIKDFFNIDLPKWPALVVVREKVSLDQAAEIIVRTSMYYLSCNDRDFEARVNELVFGVYAKRYDLAEELSIKLGVSISEAWEYQDKCIANYKHLDLGYLKNSRIMSSWVGGPHGWCDWNGNIFTNNYNIGKWPDIEAVYHEWKIIAKAFPFLSLKSQLFSGEQCEDDTRPVVQFDIKDGKVKMTIPKTVLCPPVDMPMRNIFSNQTERGCTIEQLKNALALVANKYSEELITAED